MGEPTNMMTMAQPILKVKYSDEKIKTRVNQFLSDVLDDRKYNVDKARRYKRSNKSKDYENFLVGVSTCPPKSAGSYEKSLRTITNMW